MRKSRPNAWRSYAVLVLFILVGCGALRGDERSQENENEGALGRVLSPVRVGTDTYSQVDAGTHFACAVRSDARLLCWGLNGNGQLGVGDSNDRATPTLVGTACDGKPWWTYDSGDKKYRGENGDECAYDDNGDLLPDTRGRYTYNFAPYPYGGTITLLAHLVVDVAQHFICGGHGRYDAGLTGSD